MKFVDQAVAQVTAGNGGNGRTSFRHEKFVDRGGPDGGDGGDGGDVVFVASRNQNTLVAFRYHKELAAENGGDGGKSRKHGKRGKDLVVPVPVGTIITHEGHLIADLTEDNATCIVAKGGRGGFGNAHFISSVRQAPKFAEPGGAGEDKELQLELKLIADVGLVGLPSAGKSTFLSVVSNARPKIADYPFTTLTPNLGVVDIPGAASILIADIPGLIEGAAEGKGLGDDFLRHVERTAVLLHLIDATSPAIAEDYATIQHELATYKINLADKPKIIALTKTDLLQPSQITAAVKRIKKVVPKTDRVCAVSAQAHQGVRELLFELANVVKTEREHAAADEMTAEADDALPVLTLDDDSHWEVDESAGEFTVLGGIADKFSVRTDFANEESVQRLRSILAKHGVLHELTRRGAKLGDTIHLKSGSFEL